MSVKLLVMCHGSGVDNLIIPNGAFHPEASILHAAINEGWTVISPYAHGDIWGNAQARTDFVNAISVVTAGSGQRKAHTIAKTVVHGTSMGGTSAFAGILANAWPNLKGVYLNDGAINLVDFFGNAAGSALGTAYGVSFATVSAPGVTAGASSLALTAPFPAGTVLQIEASQGGNSENVTVGPAGPSGTGPYTHPLVTATTKTHATNATVSDFPNKIGGATGYDPMQHPASDYPNIRYRFCVSNADATVRRAYNGDLMATKLAAMKEASVNIHLGGHASVESFWPSDFISFLRRCDAD